MKTLDKGKDKIKEICKILREESLQPAQQEARKILSDAHQEASEIIRQSKEEANKILADARKAIEKEHMVFKASLKQACVQTLNALRQEIEKELFDKELESVLPQITEDPKTLAHLINAIVESLEKQGIDSDLDALIPQKVPAKSINALLLKGVERRLRGEGVRVGAISGGVQVKIVDDNIVIDLSDQTIKEMVAQYVRKDFHETLYGEE